MLIQNVVTISEGLGIGQVIIWVKNDENVDILPIYVNMQYTAVTAFNDNTVLLESGESDEKIERPLDVG